MNTKAYIAAILVCLLMAAMTGCTQKMYVDKVWDEEHNLVKETTVKLNGFGAEHEARVILVYIKGDEKILFVGNYNQLLNPEAIKAAFKGISEAILEGWGLVK